MTDIETRMTDISVDLQTAEARVKAWQADPNKTTNHALVEALVQLDRGLTPHLDVEEKEILPLAAQCINAMEWGELPAHGMQHFGRGELWMAIGLVRDELSPTNLADMNAHLPPPLASMWTESGESLYQQFSEELWN